jgi:hypothetical protein
MSRFQVIRVHAPSARREVLANADTRAKAENLRNQYAAKLTPQEIQSGYQIQIIPSSN